MSSGAASPRLSKAAILLLLIVIVAAAGYLGSFFFRAPRRPKSLAWFYNERTAALFTAVDQMIPPIDTESGAGTGVKAYIFTCGDCNDSSQRFIAFLEKMTPEGKEAVISQIKNDKSGVGLGFAMEKLELAVLVRSLENQEWYLKFSSEGQMVMASGKKRGGCENPLLCLP
jgi:hypothetical protein